MFTRSNRGAATNMKALLTSTLIVLLTLCFALAANADDEAKKRLQAEQLVTDFWKRVWSPPPDLRAVDDLVVEDFVLTSAGKEVKGRAAFKAWIEDFQKKAKDVWLEAFETFSNTDAMRVTSRWRASGPKLAQNWVERSAWELYQELATQPAN